MNRIARRNVSDSFSLLMTTSLVLAVPAAALPGKDELLSKMFLKSVKSWHYEPGRLDDSFSEDVFDLYLAGLDPQKRYLLRSDVEALGKFRHELDDELRRGSLEFLDASGAVLKTRLQEVRETVEKLLSRPLDLSVMDSLELDPEKLEYPGGAAERRDRWRRLLKYQMLTRLRNALEADSSTADARKGAGKDDAALEAKTREQVLSNVLRSIDRRLQEKRGDRVAAYLNAAGNVFDPHTQYLKPQAREDFDLSMSGTLEGIGAILREEDGYIKVVSIVPGSASWRQKHLKAEDKILKVAQAGEDPVDIVGMSVNDAVRLIRGRKGSEVRLTVQKPGGQIVVIPIVRDVVVVEETFAKSAVLRPEKGERKWGYVELPTFYHDFSRDDGRNSSDDVRKEIAALKAQGTEGLILDLRNNGGGALEDAVKLAGLFIEAGPVVQIKDKNGRSRVLADDDSSVAWKGPLVVLVNSFSASASEIVAAALQDYGRAVIVGSDTTFGKGTVQSMINLDAYLPPLFSPFKPMGSLKLTIQKFYRIDGGSTQYRGVVPDILIPDGYSELELGEKTMDHPLAWDQADSADYRRWNGARLDLAALKARVAERLEQSQLFRKLEEQYRAMRSRRENTRVVLQKEAFFRDQERADGEAKAYEKLAKEKLPLSVTQVVEKGAKPLPEEAEARREWEEGLKSDFHVHQAAQVLGDLMALHKEPVTDLSATEASMR